MISIHILDYVYGSGGQNQISLNNATFNTSATYPWQQITSTEAKIVNQATGTKYLSPVSGLMTKGQEYTISATVVDYTGSGGSIGFSSADHSGTPNGVGTTARRSSDGNISHTFTATGFQDVKIFSGVNGGGTLRDMRLRPTSSIDWKESVLGNLDVGNSKDFPLAMTFSIAEARDLNSRTGTYSKSFRIPATKNNNRILKTSYMSGSISSDQSEINLSNNIHKKKPCRIIIDGNYSIEGFFQLTSVEQSSSPSYYSCVFYGDNVSWASTIETKLLRNLATQGGGADGSGWDLLNGKVGTGLELTYAGITSVWETVNATDTKPWGGAVATNTNSVVYPTVGYGETNETGEEGTMQLLRTAHEANGWSATKTGNWGWDSSGAYSGAPGASYGSPEPVLDWRPGIFIYDIVKQIFAQEGYRVSSNFIETDMFKSLIMLLPNFRYSNSAERVKSWSAGGSFSFGSIREVTYISGAISSGGVSYSNHTLRFNYDGNFVQNPDFDNTSYNDTNGYFTVAEAGYYDVEIGNTSVSWDSMCEGTAEAVTLDYIKLNMEAQTVGESSWNKLLDTYAVNTNIVYPAGCANFNHPGGPDSPANNADFPDALSLERMFFNKGDKVRFIVKIKTKNDEATSETIGYKMQFWGGLQLGQTSVGAGNWKYRADNSGVVNFKFYGEEAAYAQTYDLKNVIDTESTQMGFLKGVIHAFNLYMTTDVASKTVFIEPFNDFFENQNLAVDWTGKVDLSQNQDDKWVESDFAREVTFKYKSDSNDKVVENKGVVFWDGVMDTYPYREFLSDDYKSGTSLFENPFFAGTWDANDGTLNAAGNLANRCVFSPSSGVLWGVNDDGSIPIGCTDARPPKGNNFLPRMLTYIRDTNNPDSSISRWWTTLELWGTQYGKLVTGEPMQWDVPVMGAFPPTDVWPILPRAVCVDSMPDIYNRTPVLTYGTVKRSGWDNLDPFGAGAAMQFDRGLYQTYYERMIVMMRESNRIKVVSLNLKISDIMNLNLKKLVYIDGYYYRINRVVDYQPNNNNPTQVELLLWQDTGEGIPGAAPGFNDPWA